VTGGSDGVAGTTIDEPTVAGAADELAVLVGPTVEIDGSNALGEGAGLVHAASPSINAPANA